MKPLFQFLPLMIIALIFGGAALWWGSHSVWEGLASSSWPQTTGTIRESRVNSQYGSHGTAYSPAIFYDYTVDGQTYRSSRVDTRGAWDAVTSQQVVNAYPAGSQRPVYYSPSAPGDCILVKGLHRSSFFGLVLGVLILSMGALISTGGYLVTMGKQSPGGNSYALDPNTNPTVGSILALGFVVVACEFGLLFWTCY